MGVAAGLAAGLLGAIVWALIAWYGNMEIGWLAWGIGAAVGFACAAGSAMGRADKEAQTGAGLGIAAVLITILSICGGKYATVEAGVQQGVTEIRLQADGQIDQEFTEEQLVSWVADQIGEETHGPMWQEQYKWPDGGDPSIAGTKAEYPVNLWRQAETKWKAMPETDRTAFEANTRETIRQNYEAFLSVATNEARQEGFKSSFGAMDLLFFGLAVFTAWKIAGAGEVSD